MNELFELFQELAVLVQAQGEILDNIEQNLIDTNDYLEKAENNLDNAQQIAETNRNRMCWIIIVVGAAGFILIAVALLFDWI